MSTLYQISNKMMEFYYTKDEFTPEDQKEIEEFLNKELQKKTTGIVAVIRDKELLVENIDTEIKRLQELKKSIINKTENLKEMTKEQMAFLNLPKVETPLGIMTIAKNPMSVEIIDEEKVSKAFKKEKIVETVDKTAIKKHFLETGEIVEGINIINDKTSLRIK